MKNERLLQLAKLANKHDQFSNEIRTAAVAVTATEMQFRPFPHRCVEYAYVLCMLLFKQDVSFVSVGISQISIRHYRSQFGFSQFQALFHSMSAQKNLLLCCKLLESSNMNTLDKMREVYNGKSTFFYKRALRKNHELLVKLEALRETHRERASI